MAIALALILGADRSSFGGVEVKPPGQKNEGIASPHPGRLRLASFETQIDTAHRPLVARVAQPLDRMRSLEAKTAEHFLQQEISVADTGSVDNACKACQIRASTWELLSAWGKWQEI